MARFWKRDRGPLDLEAELRASRPEPRPEFVQMLGTRVRESGRRAGSLRIAFAGGLTALMLVAVASVGGVSYAAGGAHGVWQSAHKLVSKHSKSHRTAPAKSSAKDQYGGQEKVTICHHTGSKKNPTETIQVSKSAVPGHLKHGDSVGPCSQGTPKGGVKGTGVGFAG